MVRDRAGIDPPDRLIREQSLGDIDEELDPGGRPRKTLVIGRFPRPRGSGADAGQKDGAGNRIAAAAKSRNADIAAECECANRTLDEAPYLGLLHDGRTGASLPAGRFERKELLQGNRNIPQRSCEVEMQPAPVREPTTLAAQFLAVLSAEGALDIARALTPRLDQSAAMPVERP